MFAHVVKGKRGNEMLKPDDNVVDVLKRFDEAIELHEKIIITLSLGMTALWASKKLDDFRLDKKQRR